MITSTTRTPVVSVIVAVYRQPLLLEWQLALLAAQDIGEPFEVLVCDDGSDREILEVVEAAARRHGLDVRYAWQPDSGFRASRSRNNGIRLARGDLLVFLDADQVMAPGFLARHAAAHRTAPHVVAGAVTRIELHQRPTGARDALALAQAHASGGAHAFPEAQHEWVASPYDWMTVLSGNMSCTRGAEVCFDERFVGWGGEDREFAYRLIARHGYGLTFEPLALTYHLSLDREALESREPARVHRRIVQFLRNRLYLKSLYPHDDLTPLFDMLRACRLNRTTNTWFLAPPDQRSPDDVLLRASDWLARHGGDHGNQDQEV
jgi:glycosyltransferase involved in cell wall biosynthesis